MRKKGKTGQHKFILQQIKYSLVKKKYTSVYWKYIKILQKIQQVYFSHIFPSLLSTKGNLTHSVTLKCFIFSEYKK